MEELDGEAGPVAVSPDKVGRGYRNHAVAPFYRLAVSAALGLAFVLGTTGCGSEPSTGRKGATFTPRVPEFTKEKVFQGEWALHYDPNVLGDVVLDAKVKQPN